MRRLGIQSAVFRMFCPYRGEASALGRKADALSGFLIGADSLFKGRVVQVAMSGKKPSSCDFGQRPNLDLVAELGDLGGQALGFDLGGTAIEVVGTEVLVFGAVFEHVVDCGKH